MEVPSHDVHDVQVQVHHLDSAHEMVDQCMASALRQRKPVYINVCCNIAGAALSKRCSVLHLNRKMVLFRIMEQMAL